ncbi:MAG TPA: asparagine synthase (glutamine-hydrolyzing) [Candidatus Eisenbacteria bacterium]|nr:asparagine synthase (glutamine-hydrolyzing) [Candidatus Eisenbacteria bacterium]
MCGIAGELHFDASRPVSPEAVLRMTRALAHRGPDDEGLFVRGPVGLGHRRLSILDLSSAGHQPMSNEDGSIWLVFNGEIYNFLELRDELERDGVTFRSRTDTEVLLRLYEQRGTSCLHALRGMFAFAIWDARRQALFLARDRLGVKPLFYHIGNRALTFASELKALTQNPEVRREVDPAAIHHYLTYQYVPSPLCVYRGVRKLPPAHYLVWRDGRKEIHRYWKLRYLPKFPVKGARSERELEAELREKVEEATRLRLIADVPVGAFLSGGIDSSVIVATMARLSDEPVHTFSIGFQEKSYDELPSARILSKLYGTRHTEYCVRPDVRDLLPALVKSYDEPYADASAIPTFVLSKLARREVKVVLTGDAGDENFAGYDRYLANEFARRLGRMAAVLGSRVMKLLVQNVPHGAGQRDFRWRLKRFVDQVAKSPRARNAGWIFQFDRAAKAELYTPEFAEQVLSLDSEQFVFDRYRESEAEDFLDEALYADVTTYLPDCLLVKADIATMAHGLEARSPFLDHPLMEFAARLPADLKIRGREPKWILKRAFRDRLPASILERPKMGFNLPLDSWLKNELADMSWDLLLGERGRSRGYFRPESVKRLLTEHRLGRWNWHDEIWTLLLLEMWHREFVDPPVAMAEEASEIDCGAAGA